MSTLNQRISNFKSKVLDKAALARPNLFRVDLDFPASVKAATSHISGGGKYTADSDKLGKFQVRAAQLPSTTIGVVEVPFRGRMLKIAGDRTFEPWTITVMNDEDHRLRSAFEIWVSMIQSQDTNFQELGIDANSGDTVYKDMKVTQLSRGTYDSKANGNLLQYKFKHCYPSSVSAIDLDWGSNDAIQEFTVEFQLSHWVSEYK